MHINVPMYGPLLLYGMHYFEIIEIIYQLFMYPAVS